ncbi:PBP1A family penicillin-binding protein [Pelagibacteraceae bacterium]|nr:PBP1A family penicillin-binding protein [Pelagibacteraceae bacterium]
MFNHFNTLIKTAIVIGLFILFLLFSALWYFSSGLPDYKKLENYEPPVSSRVYASNGDLIAEYAIEKRLFIPYEAIPKPVINAFLSAEDKNFFDHPGIDPKGIIRAVINNFKNIINDKRLEGASTITQQVAKNFLLTNEVSLKRKIKEAILAFRIEKAYSKERILELYLNQIYLGSGTYGIAAASLEYFDKSVKELNYSEAALLAALPKAPSKYNPFRFYEEAKLRRNLVLQNLNDNKFINKSELQKYKSAEISLKKRKIKLLQEANYYTEEIRRVIKDNYGFDKLYAEGLSIKSPLDINYQLYALSALRSGIESYDRRQGWRGPILNTKTQNNWQEILKQKKIDTSLDWTFAEILNVEDSGIIFKILNKKTKEKISINNLKWAVKKNIYNSFKVNDIIYVHKNLNGKWELKQYPKVNGAIVAIDPFSGKVKALAGGFSFESSEFNRATQANRQPGSAFKPFVYAAALENNFSPNSIILDAPFTAKQGVGLKNWKPENYGKEFYGPTTLRKGVEYSRNLMTVRIAQELGLNKILQLSNDLDIYNEIPELLSVSLGSAETTLLKITNAYSTFVNGGKKINPILIERIQDRRGKTIYNSDKRECVGCDKFSETEKSIPFLKDNYKQVISKETAYQILSILEGTVKRGTGKNLRDLNVPLAGKTGTTNDNYDAWFIGATSNLVVGVYIGYDNPRTLGKYETGAKAALPIFKRFIRQALFKDEFKSFTAPEEIFFAAINYNSGKKENFSNKESIIEAFKLSDIKKMRNNNLNKNLNYDSLVKYRQFY